MTKEKIESLKSLRRPKRDFECVYKIGERFQALVNVNGKKVYFGTFDTPEEAFEKVCEVREAKKEPLSRS